jgi:hypothetical protein
MSGDPKDLRADELGRKSWLEDIGPEGMSDADKASQLDQYGFDKMGIDDELSHPGAEDVTEDAKSDVEAAVEPGEHLGDVLMGALDPDPTSFRPVEDEAIDDLEG